MILVPGVLVSIIISILVLNRFVVSFMSCIALYSWDLWLKYFLGRIIKFSKKLHWMGYYEYYYYYEYGFSDIYLGVFLLTWLAYFSKVKSSLKFVPLSYFGKVILYIWVLLRVAVILPLYYALEFYPKMSLYLSGEIVSSCTVICI